MFDIPVKSLVCIQMEFDSELLWASTISQGDQSSFLYQKKKSIFFNSSVNDYT